jgi:polyphenol oxidase
MSGCDGRVVRMSESSNMQYDDMIVDSSAMDPVDQQGNPIPVTIPIELARNVKVVYTTRLGGNSSGDWASCNLGGKSGDDPKAVAANRAAVSKAVGAPLSLVAQVHSGHVVDADEFVDADAPYGYDWSGAESVDGREFEASRRIEADGQVTTRTGLALGAFAADCLPVLMADSEAGVIAVAHCGRRGLENGVVGATIEAMRRKGASVKRIVATLGPCICGDCYEVGDQVAAEFEARFPDTRTVTRFGGAGIDIAKAALRELSHAGVTGDHIVNSRPRVAAATQYLEYDEELGAICATDGAGASAAQAASVLQTKAVDELTVATGVSTQGESTMAVESATEETLTVTVSARIAAQARESAICPDLSARIEAMRHPMCTLENPLWYSHRRSAFARKPHEGRMLALIVREE